MVGDVYALEESLFSELHFDDPLSYSVIVKNVRQGSCTVIKNHTNDNFIVVDAGSSSAEPVDKEAYLARLFGFSEESPDVPFSENTISIIVSHSDEDHINLFKTVFGINSTLLDRVGLIVLGDHFSNYFRLDKQGKPVEETRNFLRNFVLRVPNYRTKLISLSHNIDGIEINDLLKLPLVTIPKTRYSSFYTQRKLNIFFSAQQLTNPTNTFEILSANAGEGSESKETDTNANSAIVRLSFNEHNILIMGDATGHTTNRILNVIDNPKILRSDLLIMSHHGSDTDNTNHITWAAVTAPKHIAVSSGFKYTHPTLTAITNFLATDCVSQEMSESALGIDPEKLIDEHYLSIHNAFGEHVLKLKPKIGKLELINLNAQNARWILFSTKHSIYSTIDSGDLVYTFSNNGLLISFVREY